MSCLLVGLATGATLSACGDAASTAGKVGSPEIGGDGDAACVLPLDDPQPFGGCLEAFDDTSWKDTLCSISSSLTASEQACSGSLLREMHFGTRTERCYYDVTSRRLSAAHVADTVASFCDHRSKVAVYGTLPTPGDCASAPVAIVDPCKTSTTRPMCADPSAPAPAPPCAAGWYLYDDVMCSPATPPNQPVCGHVGDRLCHKTCNVDADCTDPCSPKCTSIQVFDGGDVLHLKYVCGKAE